MYTEEDWADPESPTIDAYSKSKTLAEKAAWDYLKELPGWLIYAKELKYFSIFVKSSK